MNGLEPSRWYSFYRQPANMRKNFDGTRALVLSGMKKNPVSGDAFVFTNRRRSHLQASCTGPE